MTTNAERRGRDKSSRGLVNPPRPAGRYRLLDRNSDPDRCMPPIPDGAPGDRPCNPYCQRGS